MGVDDPTLPGRPSRRRPSLSARSIRVVGEITPLLVRAFALPQGTEREGLLAEAIGRAIDAGRESGDAMRAEIERLRGERNDERQAKELLTEKCARLQKTLDVLGARLARGGH